MNNYHVKILQALGAGSLDLTKIRRKLLEHGIDIGPDYATFLLAELINAKKVIRSQARTGWLYSLEVTRESA